MACRHLRHTFTFFFRYKDCLYGYLLTLRLQLPFAGTQLKQSFQLPAPCNHFICEMKKKSFLIATTACFAFKVILRSSNNGNRFQNGRPESIEFILSSKTKFAVHNFLFIAVVWIQDAPYYSWKSTPRANGRFPLPIIIQITSPSLSFVKIWNKLCVRKQTTSLC